MDDAWYTEQDNHGESNWNKMQDEFVNIGYREGITSGKENSLQEGFDQGFKMTGAPLGRQLGVLRGMVTGLSAILQNMKPSQAFPGSPMDDQEILHIRNELQELSLRLNNLRLKDIAPRDSEAEAHAREHMDVEKEDTDDALANAIMDLGVTERPDGMKELVTIQERLQNITERLGIRGALRI